MWKLSLLLSASLLLSGCQTTADGSVPASELKVISGPAASAIAGDMAARFAEQMGPGGKTAFLPDKGPPEIASALEAALKGWGYTIVYAENDPKAAKPVKLGWSIDEIDGQVLARIWTPTIALGRTYKLTTAGAEPASPLSVLRRS